jgi:hypothetical protein
VFRIRQPRPPCQLTLFINAATVGRRQRRRCSVVPALPPDLSTKQQHQHQQHQHPVVHGLRCCSAVARRCRAMCWGAGRSPSRRTPTCCTRSPRRPGPPAAPTTTRGATSTGAASLKTTQFHRDKGRCCSSLGASRCGGCSSACVRPVCREHDVSVARGASVGHDSCIGAHTVIDEDAQVLRQGGLPACEAPVLDAIC